MSEPVPITPQRVFDLAWQEFIVEKAPPAGQPISGAGTFAMSCLYLTPEGHKCAIGLALPEGHKAQDYSGNVSGLCALYPELFESPERDSSILDELQAELHDNLMQNNVTKTGVEWSYSLEERKRRYIAAAKLYGLKVPNADERATNRG